MARTVHAPLYIWEQTVYWVAEIFTVGYMIYSLYQASDNAWKDNEKIRLEEGWAVLGRPRDSADYEWEFWSLFFWRILPFLVGHTTLSFMCTKVCDSVKSKQSVVLLYDVLALCYLMGSYTVLFMCVHPVLCYFTSYFASSIAVWVVTLAFIGLLNMYPESIIDFLHGFFDEHSRHNFHAWFYMCVFVWANLCQRAVSFALECVWVRQKEKLLKPVKTKPAKPDSRPQRPRKLTTSDTGSETVLQNIDNGTKKSDDVFWCSTLNELPGWLDMFYYMFYFPVFFTGPLIVYKDFHKQVRTPAPYSKKRVKDIAFKLARIMMWAVINCVILHYIYPHAINQSRIVLAKQSRWTLAAIGWSMGQFFMMKYLVIFGLPAQVARFDGFEPPSVPACISYVYCYGDMWKSFDRGLYDFLKRYIFIPCGGSRAGPFRQLLGSAVCFAYIFHWHGGEWYLFLWCVVNFVETSLEQVGGWLESTRFVKKNFYKFLSEKGKRRVRASASIPLFLMSVFAIFYFFGGAELTGDVFVSKLLVSTSWWNLFVFLALVYCAIQNAMEVERLGLTKYKALPYKEATD